MSANILAESATDSAQGDILPNGVPVGAGLSVGGGGKSGAAGTEVVADSAEWTQQALGVLDRFEALQDLLALTCRQVRVFGAVVQPLVAPMLAVR
jgi:hypothetical protein